MNSMKHDDGFILFRECEVKGMFVTAYDDFETFLQAEPQWLDLKTSPRFSRSDEPFNEYVFDIMKNSYRRFYVMERKGFLRAISNIKKYDESDLIYNCKWWTVCKDFEFDLLQAIDNREIPKNWRVEND